MQVSEIMHQGIVSVDITDNLKKVASIMTDEDIGALPVLEDGRPVGFVTDLDIVISCVAEGLSFNEPISKAMTEDIVTVSPDQDVSEAMLIMQENQISRLLVLDGDKPVGMISLQDLTEINDEQLAGETVSKIKEH